MRLWRVLVVVAVGGCIAVWMYKAREVAPGGAAASHTRTRDERYRAELLPQVAARLGLPANQTAALRELDRRFQAEQNRILDRVDSAATLAESSTDLLSLSSAYGRAQLRVLGNVERVNQFDRLVAKAAAGTLDEPPPPPRPPEANPDPRYTIKFVDYGAPNTPNRYDDYFRDVTPEHAPVE
jgi:hypothetical protein